MQHNCKHAAMPPGMLHRRRLRCSGAAGVATSDTLHGFPAAAHLALLGKGLHAQQHKAEGQALQQGQAQGASSQRTATYGAVARR